MQEKAKVIYFAATTILLIGIATLIWANQTHKITIWGAPICTTDSNGIMSCSEDVAPSIDFQANPNTVSVGGTSTLTWNVNNASEVKLTADCGTIEFPGGGIPKCFGVSTFEVSSSGTMYVKPKAANAGQQLSYTISAKGGTSSATPASKQLYVTVNSSNTNPTPTPTQALNGFNFKMDSSSCVNGAQVNVFSWTPDSSASTYMFITRPKPFDTGVNSNTTSTSYTWNSSVFGQSWYKDFDSLIFEVVSVNGNNYTWATPVNGNGASAVQSYVYDTKGITVSGLQVPKLTCPNASADTQAPSQPQSLQTQNPSQNEVTLTWGPSTDNIGVASYDIYNAETNQLVNSSTSNSWTMTGANCGTTYKFYIIARDAAGNQSQKSETVSFTTTACNQSADSVSPTKPTDLTSVTFSNGNSKDCLSTQISWKASSDNVGVTGYDIFDSKSNRLITTTQNTGYLFSKSAENTEYDLAIKSHDAAGNISDPSNTLVIKTGSCASQSSSSNNQNNSSVKKLVSTGETLWFNILVALIISGIISFFLFRKSNQS